MSHRPLVLVAGLTLGDYLLWNWSLGANHDLLALASGLTLPALALAFMWLLLVNFGRLLARSGRRPRSAAGAGSSRAGRARMEDRRTERPLRAHPSGAGGAASGEEPAAQSGPARPGRLAA